jgi:exosortase/archaeosortase family protein
VTREGRQALLRATLVVVVTTAAFFAFERPMRELEAAAAVGLIRLLGAGGVASGGSALIAVFPAGREPFIALVTAACSSLPALLAIAALGSVATPGPARRRIPAIGAALAVVLLGNGLRIAGSVAVGLVAGRASLVLFHDWVGSIFTFAYALGGYMLMLWLLLPERRRGSAGEARVVAG